MARKSTIKLLLINESDNEGERLISLFRNAGRVARAHRASSAEDLYNKLESDSWDLLIANDKHPEIAVEQCLEQLQKLAIYLPAIIIRDSNAEAVLELGACDVIASDNDQRLVFAAFRELKHLEQHRELVQVKEKLADAEERSEQLMAQSQDAIAYVADGMIIHANPLFCTRFGYSEPEDLDCSPIIDLLDADDHDKFKGLLKSQSLNNEGSTDFTFTGCRKDSETFTAAMQLSSSVFDDEHCIQLTVRDQLTSGGSGGSASLDHDPATGLYSHNYFLSQLDSYAKQAVAGTSINTLLYIGIDKYDNIRRRLGITSAYNILLETAKTIRDNNSEQNCLAHFCDDGFTMLLADTGAAKAKTYAESLCEKISNQVMEIDGNSVQSTVSIGLLVLDNQILAEVNYLIDSAFSACEQVRIDADNDGIGNGISQFIPVREKRALSSAQDDDELDTLLEEALEDERFSLTFQPIVSLRGTEGEHYEVQTNVIDDDENITTVSEFLSNLDFNKVNTRLDRWIILEATKQLSSHIEDDLDTRLLINLSANTLQDKSLIAWLGVVLKAGNIPPQSIILQFSETDISHYLKPAIAFAQSIKKMGCKLSITAYSGTDNAVKALQQVNADFAKLADNLSKELESGGDTQILKDTITTMNENSTQGIIGNVENAASLAMLWQIGVDYIQGGYLADPALNMNYEFTDIA